PPIEIRTALGESGVEWAKGEEITILRPRDGSIDLIHAPDEIQIDIDDFNKRVIVPAYNRAVCAELAKHIDPSAPGKTLVFCVNDRHADDVVGELQRAFAARYGACGHDVVIKITGKSDNDPEQLIRHFKNETNPRVAVTVDLLTTGIDVPQIVNLVFLRRVRSRILYDQMVGRATRLCEDIGKRWFRIFDPVGLYDVLQDYTDMRPVVSDLQTTFARLIDALDRALAKAQPDDARQELCEQLQAKLQRVRRSFRQAEEDRFLQLSGHAPIELIRRMADWTPAEALDWWREHETLAAWLDQPRKGRGEGPVLLISDHEDTVAEVVSHFGPKQQGAAAYLA
ncbi:MAG: type I restriction-modification system endonuclease, partial [Myxococcales bacterium]|nr:type I restriction-modification system endonuclease [Myxococcales bacterium]